MNTETITIAATELKIRPAADSADHVEEVLHHCTFLKSDLPFRIWDKGSRPNQDRYRYEDADYNCYSHPTLAGARQMIAKSLVAKGLIVVPTDNSHLTQMNEIQATQIQTRRNALEGNKPKTGDIVYIDGIKHRICMNHKFGAQTCRTGSFHISKSGNASFSGGLDRSRLYEGFHKRETQAPASFWMWEATKGMGAGNGRDFYLSTNVWDWIEPNLTQEQCLAHASIQEHRRLFPKNEAYRHVETDIFRMVEDMMLGFGA